MTRKKFAALAAANFVGQRAAGIAASNMTRKKFAALAAANLAGNQIAQIEMMRRGEYALRR